MIIVHVKHYLNDEGVKYIQKWYKKVKVYMEKQPGYIGFTLDEIKDDEVKLTVKFENEKGLTHWIATKEHGEVVNLLDSYRSQSYWHAARTHVENAKLDNLEWTEIKAESAPL